MIARIFVQLLSIVSFIAMFVALPGCHKDAQTASTSNDEALQQVRLSKLILTQTPLKVSAYASVYSPSSVTLTAQANAVVRAIDFKSGQRVYKGEHLFTLQPSSVLMTIGELKAKMLSAKADYERKYNANRAFYGSISKTDIQTAWYTYQQSSAEYQTALKQMYVVAPISGIITDTILAKGEPITVGTVLASIVTAGSLELIYQLPSHYVHHIKVGQSVVFTPVNMKQAFKGKVSYVAPALSSKTFDINIRASCKNCAGKLQPNSFGQVIQVIDSSHRSVLLPTSAVQTDALGYYIYQVKLGKIVKVYFKADSLTNQNQVRVASGLKAGDSYVSSDVSILSVGQKVDVLAHA